MITEDFVSFEIAKLLKKKGFDEATIGYYYTISEIPEKIKFFDSPISIYHSEGLIGCIQAPTLQMAMKWLRKEHNLNPVPYALSLGWAFDVFDLSNRDITGCKKLYSMDLPSKPETYNTYEEACEAAIKYCLENLI